MKAVVINNTIGVGGCGQSRRPMSPSFLVKFCQVEVEDLKVIR